MHKQRSIPTRVGKTLILQSLTSEDLENKAFYAGLSGSNKEKQNLPSEHSTTARNLEKVGQAGRCPSNGEIVQYSEMHPQRVGWRINQWVALKRHVLCIYPAFRNQFDAG